MKCGIVGVERRQGSFTPSDKPGEKIAYDNFVIHAVCSSRSVTGQAVTTIKMKAKEAAELIADVGGSAANLVGHTVEFDFDQNGRCVDYQVMD